MPTPRVFIVRHGETTWSLSGQHTSTTDIPLTPAGERRIRATGQALVGRDRLIVPSNLAHVYVSPRLRAQRTLELLGVVEKCKEEAERGGGECKVQVEVTDAVSEWNYGDYEGLTSKEIREKRNDWDIWRDGCPNGESPSQITARLDALISEIRTKYHGPAFSSTSDEKVPSDVLIVAHGHILRSFAARWVGEALEGNPGLILEAGGVGTLSYEHHNINEPAILLGGAFVVDIVEKEAEK